MYKEKTPADPTIFPLSIFWFCMYTLFFDLFGHLTGTSHHDPLIVFGRAARALPCLCTF